MEQQTQAGEFQSHSESECRSSFRYPSCRHKRKPKAAVTRLLLPPSSAALGSHTHSLSLGLVAHDTIQRRMNTIADRARTRMRMRIASGLQCVCTAVRPPQATTAASAVGGAAASERAREESKCAASERGKEANAARDGHRPSNVAGGIAQHRACVTWKGRAGGVLRYTSMMRLRRWQWLW